MSAPDAAGLARLNALPPPEARAALLACCGSARWAAAVADARPFQTPEGLRSEARRAWMALGPPDRLEAFAAHPEIGAERPGPAPTREWSRREQASMATADEATRAALAAGQRAYRERFGYIFLVRAAGRSPTEMLAELHRRLAHAPEAELAVASDEQWQITALRLSRFLESEESP